MVRLRLFPIGGDNTLAEDREVLVASLVSGFPLNIGAIITKEINCRERRSCPILVGIDVETYATETYDLEKSKDESRYDLKLRKPIPEVFRPSGQTARATKTSIEPAGEAT
ncbi:hypothetical protein HAX54_033914 [Datura stramonium]|uniref:Uncharacterized protein n=1 Tax=Datura stramonium TaxID=4076 RepID=A0ABS8SDT8_DATST|nr:hypothetical protein [Datura stramonium]